MILNLNFLSFISPGGGSEGLYFVHVKIVSQGQGSVNLKSVYFPDFSREAVMPLLPDGSCNVFPILTSLLSLFSSFLCASVHGQP